jgi:uncharacterized protein YciI
MEKLLYVMMIEKTKSYNRLNKEAVTQHVENLRTLDDEGKLELCGPFKGYPGMAGMIVLRTESYEEAEDICKAEPLVVGGYATYKLATLQVADKENNYLL